MAYTHTHTHTHTHTQPFYSCMDFVWDNPGEPVPEETFTVWHLSWSSIVLYLLLPYTTIHGILPVQSTCLTVFFHYLSPSFLWSTCWPGALHFIRSDGWRNVWGMKWWVPGQEVDQRKLGERLWKMTLRHINWTGRLSWIVIDGGSR